MLSRRISSCSQEGQDLLSELDGLNGSDDRFGELVAELRKHVAFEGTVLLQEEVTH